MDGIFAAAGKTYHPPKLIVVGPGSTPRAFAQSAMGPFDRPRDQRIYLDTSFFSRISRTSLAVALTARPWIFPKPM